MTDAELRALAEELRVTEGYEEQSGETNYAKIGELAVGTLALLDRLSGANVPDDRATHVAQIHAPREVRKPTLSSRTVACYQKALRELAIAMPMRSLLEKAPTAIRTVAGERFYDGRTVMVVRDAEQRIVGWFDHINGSYDFTENAKGMLR